MLGASECKACRIERAIKMQPANVHDLVLHLQTVYHQCKELAQEKQEVLRAQSSLEFSKENLTASNFAPPGKSQPLRNRKLSENGVPGRDDRYVGTRPLVQVLKCIAVNQRRKRLGWKTQDPPLQRNLQSVLPLQLQAMRPSVKG